MRHTGAMLYAEDLTIGSVYPTGSWEMTAEDITRFALEWDPVPFHIDLEAAEASPFGGLIASGMHTMCIAVKLAYVSFFTDVALWAARGVREMRLLKPVRPGMTLSGQVEVLEQRLRDDGRGVVVFQNQLTDETGDPVIRFIVDTLVYRRPRPQPARTTEHADG
jgi:acyl dehydratase